MAHGTGTTTNYALRYPVGGDPVDLNQFFQDLAEDVDTKMKTNVDRTVVDNLMLMGG